MSYSLNIEEHQTNMRLMTIHLQLQKALDAEVHEEIRVEEFKEFVVKSFGDTSNKVNQELLRIPQVEKTSIEAVEKLLNEQSEEVLNTINELLGQFHARAAMAKQKLKKISTDQTAARVINEGWLKRDQPLFVPGNHCVERINDGE